VSAHVVPKALSFSGSAAPSGFEDDDKTTLESGWEEEASTTVEQGDVAEKLRALNLELPRRTITNVTSTQAGLDEPTIDDQRANAGLSMITPPSIMARLIITQGNDRGQEIEIIPGKTYTIGRAIDNDIVLTDIAVSRKHFDLRFERGAWVVADRGSGNGTLVNGSVEDQPFMLANGDQIEIGNTTFRFDHPGSPPRASAFDNRPTNGFHGAQTFETEMLEEEPSTVAGKPLRESARVETPQPAPLPPRPKTVPPPAPRPRTVSNPPPAPPVSFAPPAPAPLPAALAPTVAPHQGMQAIQPSMLHGMAQQSAHPGALPTTIPGQGPPMQPSPPHVQALPFTYPNVADHAQHMQHGHGKLMVASGMAPRDATATAHVPPTPYSNGIGFPASGFTQPPSISRRAKLVLAGAGLALAAAITTIAIIKAAGGGDDAPEAEADITDKGVEVRPIESPTQPADPPKADPPKADPPKVANDPPKTEPAKADPPPEVDPPKADPPKADPPKIEVAADPPEPDPPKADPPKADPPKVANNPPPKVDPPKVTKRDPPKADPPKVTKRDPPKADPPKVTKRDPPKADPPKRVAVAAVDTDSTKTTAAALFRGRKFNDAAKLLRATASKSSGSDVTELKTLAGLYEQFGRAFNVGMAPQTQPDDAWNRLNSAKSFDKEAVFHGEIDARLGEIASKAALRFVSTKQFFKAAQAVRLAERSGATSSTGIVRSAISDHAGELYAQAEREISSKPRDAKVKLRQIKSLVDAKNPWYVKADKLLKSS
jgi:hypothetical protein